MGSNRVIATAGLVAVAVGSVNAIGKNKRLPSTRFLIGSGVAFFLLSALAEVDQELANALAIAVCATVVLGEGGGVLSYINNGEMDTAKGQSKGYTPDNPTTPPTQVAQGQTRTVRPPVISGSGLAVRPNMN